MCERRESLPPGSTIDQVVQHEVKELGTHILVCEVNYKSQAADINILNECKIFDIRKQICSFRRC